MSEYESLSLVVSVISALVALCAMAVSLYTARDQRQIAPFVATQDESRPVLSEAQKRLRQGLAQNDLEEFSLRESPTLYSEYKRELAKLNVLEELSLFNTYALCSTPIAELLYIGGLLFSIQMCWDWGSES